MAAGSRRRSRLLDVALLVVVAAIALFVAVRVFQVKTSDLALPWGGGDLLSLYAIPKAMIQNGWFTPNPYLGYPFEQDYSRWPSPEYLQLGFLKAISLITKNPFSTVNIYYLAGFPVFAGLFFAALRWLRVNRWAAVVLAIGLATVPWHFSRLGHALYANAYAIPIGIFLIGLVASRKLDNPAAGRRWPLFLTGLVAATVIGTSGVYNAVFIALLAAAALVAQLVTGRRLLAAWRAIVVLAVIPLAVGATLAAIQLSALTAEADPVAERLPQDSVTYGGSILSLFIVEGGGWFSEKNPINQELLSLQQTINFEGAAANSTFGVLAVIVTLLLVALALLASRPRPRWLKQFAASTSYWPGLAVVGILLFVTTGLGSVLAVVVSPQLRSWGRMSILILALCFVTLGLAVTPVLKKLAKNRRWLPPLLAAPFLALVLVDSLTMNFQAGKAVGAEADKNMTAYVAKGEAILGKDCAILELPTESFPEAPPIQEKMPQYSALWPYLYSDGWQFSYGGFRGSREGDWAATLSADPAVKVKQAKAAGFCAVQLDRLGFEFPNRVQAQYAALLGAPIVTQANRWILFDLIKVELAPFTHDGVVNPVLVEAGKGFYPTERDDHATWQWTNSQNAELWAVNPAAKPNTGRLSMKLLSAECAATQTVTVSAGDQKREVAITNKKSQIVELNVTVPARQRVKVTLASSQPPCIINEDPYPLGVQVVDALFTS